VTQARVVVVVVVDEVGAPETMGVLNFPLGTQVYFAHPYSSWERGLNENTNGLIRQYLKKGEGLLGLSLEECNSIADRLNDRPRKTLGFVAPIELYHKLIAS
jgi:IS30 family transposase